MPETKETKGRTQVYPKCTAVSVIEYLEELYEGLVFRFALYVDSSDHIEARMLYMLPDEDEPLRTHCVGSATSPYQAAMNCLTKAVEGTDHKLALQSEARKEKLGELPSKEKRLVKSPPNLYRLHETSQTKGQSQGTKKILAIDE